MTLESSVEEFASRFAEFAASGTVYPQPEGSPLIEFVTGGRVLYLFDRSGPYAVKPGPARLVVHGVVEEAERLGADEEAREQLSMLGVSAVEGVGEVLAVSRGLCVVRARTPLVLGRFGGWPDVRVGHWLRFRTLPPLHGFHI
ncbi:hypothetical protein [Deinococcus pimensis]|uniref:hypothetical protein n=1 Tax=Deinococcus pimensis TaxID=309888 RepID=UPI0004897698|nr:hypothetical protein [Deinococcus pimensis]